jgi:O-antigen/teichoic acid export membrane protein
MVGSRSIVGGKPPSDMLEDSSVDLVGTVPEVTGTRAGMIVFVGLAALNAGNALFHLISARYLGPADYSELVSLLALSGLVALPLGALQLAVARSVAADVARGLQAEVAARARQGVLISLTIAVALAVVLLAATPLIKNLLSIEATLPVVLTAMLTIPSLLAPALWGVAQGLQRFVVIAGSVTLGSAFRLGLLAAMLPLGLTVDGALGATFVAMIAAAAVPLVALAPALRRPAEHVQLSSKEFLRSATPIAIGTLAITALTTIDLLVAKVALPSSEAGEYGSASLIGRLILYVPATIATVLLPKVSSRAATERGTTDILRSSLAVTVIISLLATVVLATLPGLVLDASFGSAFSEAAPLLGLFGIAMTLFAALNILLIHDLGHHSSRVAWLLLGGAGLQLGGYAVFHESGRQLLYVSITTGALLLVAYAIAGRGADR